LVWGFFIVIPGTLYQVASISEMASVQPIAGAQYVWTHYYAPKNLQRPITWVQGWITWFSWIAITAGTANVIGNIITTLVTVSYPDYVAKSWHTLLIMYSILMILALLNQFAFWLIPWIEMAAGLLHIILFIVFASVLATLGQRHSSDFVFFSKSKLSGWNNDFVSFNLGIILITWGFVGTSSQLSLPTPADFCPQASTAQSTCPKKSAKPATPSPAPCFSPSASTAVWRSP
jgi:choline transport protein